MARPDLASDVDLFAWRAERDALAVAEAAEAERAEAARRLRCAPHGELMSRRIAFQEATQKALRAGLALAAVAGARPS